MSQPPAEDQPKQWQQPSFGPSEDAEESVVSGQVVVPGEPAPPPSALESSVRVVSGLLWPVLIVLAIAGVGSFWINVILALVGTTVLNQLASDLKRRRLAKVPRIGPR